MPRGRYYRIICSKVRAFLLFLTILFLTINLAKSQTKDTIPCRIILNNTVNKNIFKAFALPYYVVFSDVNYGVFFSIGYERIFKEHNSLGLIYKNWTNHYLHYDQRENTYISVLIPEYRYYFINSSKKKYTLVNGNDSQSIWLGGSLINIHMHQKNIIGLGPNFGIRGFSGKKNKLFLDIGFRFGLLTLYPYEKFDKFFGVILHLGQQF